MLHPQYSTAPALFWLSCMPMGAKASPSPPCLRTWPTHTCQQALGPYLAWPASSQTLASQWQLCPSSRIPKVLLPACAMALPGKTRPQCQEALQPSLLPGPVRVGAAWLGASPSGVPRMGTHKSTELPPNPGLACSGACRSLTPTLASHVLQPQLHTGRLPSPAPGIHAGECLVLTQSRPPISFL